MEMKGENAAMLSAMMPKSMDLYFLGKDVMLRTNGGMTASMMGDVVTKGDEGVTYMVVHSKKTVYRVEPDKGDKGEKNPPKVTKEGTETVNGYNCTKYRVDLSGSDDKKVYQYMWCTTDIKIAKPKMEKSSGSSIFINEVEGFPVKIDQYITLSAMGGMTMNIETTLDKISETKPDAALFEIPKKYKQEKFDEKTFGKQ